MSTTPAQFVRRLYKQLEAGKGMRFTPEEMDMLVEMGAVDAVSNYAADWLRRQSEERLTAVRVDQAINTAEVYRAPRSSRPERSYLSGEAVEGSRRRARNRTKPRGTQK